MTATNTFTITPRPTHPTPIRPRRPHDFNNQWWTTSDTPQLPPSIPTNTSIPSPIPPSPDTLSLITSSDASLTAFPSNLPGSSEITSSDSTPFTSPIPTTFVPQPTTTFSDTSITEILASNTILLPSSTISSVFTTETAVQGRSINSQAVCIGDGLDASSEGLLASIILPSAIGITLWLIFAGLRSRFRQVYGLREWFVQQDLRPKPLGSSFFAFLFPHVPLVPHIPSDMSNAGRSTAGDARLFPSDEQLSQRALWISFLIVLGWSILGLAGALPLYLVQTPCIAQTSPTIIFGGVYSTLQDLSLMRLLRLFDEGTVSTSNLIQLQSRAEPRDPQHARARVIVLTALTLALGVLPALWKIIKEFNRLVAYHRSFVNVRCEGKELGWLSASNAPGFVGWGEKRLKDYIIKIGLSLSMDSQEGRQNGARSRNGDRRTRRPEERQPLNQSENANLEIDVQSLFSIGDTQALALLIDERDEILENLEIAETRYIGSFRITTPDPSIADYEPPPPEDPNRPYISRPLPLGPGTRRGRRRALNPAFAASSLAPTSFVAPSQYYKLRSVQGVSGGRFADSGIDQQPSLSESISSRVVGSRFLEVNRNSVAYGRLPLGSQVIVEKSGQLGPGSGLNSVAFSTTIPDPRRFGPNYWIESSDATQVDENGPHHANEGDVLDEEWVDLTKDAPIDFDSDFNGPPPAGPSSFMRRPKKEPVPSTRRDTFPLRNDGHAQPESVPPPHLRLQPSQPFVRPQDGLNFDDLGQVYADITQWRSKLKAINAEISNVQGESYNDIADGARIKGWLMVGRGLRFIPGMQLIEGRAKEDIRWDVLQNERSWLDSIVLWIVVVIIVVFLAAGLTAASGLALATAPDVAHYLPFLQPLLDTNPLPAGIATVLAPAVASILFISVAIITVNWVANIHGSVSISGGQLLVFKATFGILTSAAIIWITTIGALLFSLRAFTFNTKVSQIVADGSIYMSILALSIVISVAIIFPALLLLQPFRFLRVIRTERQAVTPRQRFRAVYPRTYNPTFATAACVLALVFASTFSLIFPLIGPAVSILLFLTLIAHRYLIGYVYGRTHSQTGGLLQIWLVKRFGTLLSLQPILLGLIFLSRTFWIEGGVLVGVGVFIIVFIEVYAGWKTRLPGRKSLSAITRDSLDTFETTAKATSRRTVDEESISYGSSGRGQRTRGSMASVLEMMSLTLAVMPSANTRHGPVPLPTETLDDLTATERAARTHPDAPPHLPPLPFTDHAEEMAGILYAPELIAPPPIIWLPNDSAGVARSEAVDLQKYHDLQVTLDVRAREDVTPRRSSSSRRRTSR